MAVFLLLEILPKWPDIELPIMRVNVSIFVCFLMIFSCKNEYSLEGGPKLPVDTSSNKDVYVAGVLQKDAGGLSKVDFWKNGDKTEVTDSSRYAYPEDIFVTPSKDVYIGGVTKIGAAFRACI